MFTLSFTLDQESKSKLYYQLYRNLSHGIDSGDIPEGTKIFSVRDMARELNVSRNTVTKAYSELIKAGYLVSKSKSGFYATKPQKKPRNNQKAVPSPVISESQSDDSEPTAEESLIESFKFALTLNRQMLESSGDPFGDSTFRKSISKFLKKFHGIEADPTRMVVSGGIDLMLQNLFHMQDMFRPVSKPASRGLLAMASEMKKESEAEITAILPENVNESLHRILKDCGIKEEKAVFTDSGIDINHLSHCNATILFVAPSDVMMKDEETLRQNRKDVLDWANAEEGRYIVEFDNCSVKDSRKPFKSEDVNDRVIYINTFSNLLFKAVNASWMILPERINLEYRKRYVDFDCVLSRLDQMALTDFINGGNLMNYLENLEEL